MANIHPFPEVEPGTKKKKSLKINLEGSNRPLLIPIFVIRGLENGPAVVVSSGIHGDELGAIETVKGIVKDLDPSRLRGTIFAAPVVNVPAHKEGVRNGPEDGLDLNRIFPGKAHGSISERIAHNFLNKIVLKADYCIDLHTATYPDKFIPHARVRKSDPTGRSQNLIEAFGAELIWEQKGHPGMLQSCAIDNGIPTVTIELGGGDEPESRFGFEGIMNVLKYLEMVDGSFEIPEDQIILKGNRIKIPSPIDGSFEKYVDLGTPIMEGSYIGRVSNLTSDQSTEILSTGEGIVVGICYEGDVKKGKRLFFILGIERDDEGQISSFQIKKSPELNQSSRKENTLLGLFSF